MYGITQQQLNRFFEILQASKLTSELEELLAAPSPSHYVLIQAGESDAQKISVSKLRGALGSYDVTTNTPTLTDGVGVEGDSYIATTAGTRDFGSGNVSISVDDILDYRNGKWLVNGLALTQGRVIAALGYTPLDKSTYAGTAQDLKDEIDAISNIEIVDALNSVDIDKALSANQGRVLKGFIDDINTLLTSNDTTLDELQEVVDFIKANKNDLDNLTISNIAGLQTALDAKETPAGAQAKANQAETNAKAYADSLDSNRTVKQITNTTQYTVIAADFTDFILEFTANANEEISIVINSGVAPVNGELQMISTGNNKLVPSLTGVTATYPEQTNPKTILKGWLGGIVVGTDKISFNGSLESTDTGGGGIEEAPQDGTPYSRQDSGWVAATGTTYSTFTDTEDGLVPAPNAGGGTTYSATITSPTEGFTATEGEVTTVNVDLPEGVVSSGTKKVLKSDGWQDDVAAVRPVKTVSTTTYTCVAEDATKWLRFTNASVVTVTIPNSVFTAEQELMGDSSGNNVTFTAGTGFTINKVVTKKAEIPVQGVFGMRFRAASSGVLFGSLKPL